MKSVLSIGSAVVDIFIQSSQFHLTKAGNESWLCQIAGEKLEVDRFDVKSGGGATNTAVGFARQGFFAAVIAETGKDVWSSLIRSELEQEGVNIASLILEKKEDTGGSVILLGPQGGRTVLVHRGAASQLDSQDINLELVSQADWVHISSLAGRSQTWQTIVGAIPAAAGWSWNPGQGEIELLLAGEIEPAMLERAIMFVNHQEWTSLQPRADQLHERAHMIVVTQGGQGGQIWQQGKQIHQYASQTVPVVDETGAGDAFVVGFVSEIMRGKTVAQASELGSRNAASVVGQLGAKAGLLRQVPTD